MTTKQAIYDQVSSVESLSRVQLFATPWTAACQASLSTTNSQSLLKLRSIQSVMPSNCLILCRPLLLPPSIFPSIRIFSNESLLHIRWPKYWRFSFSIRSVDTEQSFTKFSIHCWLKANKSPKLQQAAREGDLFNLRKGIYQKTKTIANILMVKY